MQRFAARGPGRTVAMKMERRITTGLLQAGKEKKGHIGNIFAGKGEAEAENAGNLKVPFWGETSLKKELGLSYCTRCCPCSAFSFCDYCSSRPLLSHSPLCKVHQASFPRKKRRAPPS